MVHSLLSKMTTSMIYLMALMLANVEHMHMTYHILQFYLPMVRLFTNHDLCFDYVVQKATFV